MTDRRRFLTLAAHLVGATLATLSLTATLSGPAQASSLDDIQSRGTLRVAVPQDFPPFGSIGADMQPQGYDIDTARYLAEQMKLDLSLVPVTSANRIPYLTTGKVDLVISSLGRNPDRARAIDFSDKYAPFFFGVFGDGATDSDDGIEAPADLAGKTIGVTRGALEDIELSKVAPENTVIKRFEDNATTISAFLSGQVGLIATGNQVAASIAARGGRHVPELAFTLKDSPCYIGVAKNNPELLARVDQLIQDGMSDGTFNALSEKWFKAPLPADFDAAGGH
ncbi:transporter substrate-binding domain-containing protein [Larsenimonas rhizosphaerae]|uniref:Transporter substrate-binding domain-containing protein n=1 Tax=Larsenimonas rhizosphaerae TaxID=2944682 RepID=A0AA42CXS2_9GAMM|nr:transporter substrate-binding domain-containing protein [Larsenimonas rhizosphaerae]MCX2524195.1 transporter substrate-binding domain-containing protein [Larsenimonas rhizosphaerae]